MKEALISIKPEYVKKIQTGVKTVEVRRKIIHLSPRDKIWVYSTLPQGEIVGYFIVDKIVRGTPEHIWENYHENIAVTKPYFKQYFNGTDTACAIIIKHYKNISNTHNLYDIREKIGCWNPPQMMHWINPKSTLNKLLYA